MYLNAPLHSSKSDISTTRYPQSPSTSSMHAVSHNNYSCKPSHVSNTSLDLNIEKRVNEKTDKKINIIELPTEILNKIFSYTGESKTNARLTCHRFNDCVRLNKKELFKIKNGELLYGNGFSKNNIHILSGKKQTLQKFILENCQYLHKAGFNGDSILFLSRDIPEAQDFLLKNGKVLREAGFKGLHIYLLIEKIACGKDIILENYDHFYDRGFSSVYTFVFNRGKRLYEIGFHMRQIISLGMLFSDE